MISKESFWEPVRLFLPLLLVLFCCRESCGFCAESIFPQARTSATSTRFALDDEPLQQRWFDPELGIPRALELRQPILMVVEFSSDPQPVLDLEQELLNRSTARAMGKVVKVRVKLTAQVDGGWQWPPETTPAVENDQVKRWSRIRAQRHIEKTLGKPRGATVIAVLDLFGRKRAQVVGKKISASALRKALKLAARECNLLSKKMDVEVRLVDKATLLLQRDDTAGCCRQLEEAQKLELPVEAPPEQRRIEVLGLLEKQWREAMARAKQFERKNRLGEAASAYEKILKDFPHDPWEKQIRAEIGRIWGRIRGPGGGL